MSTDHWIELPTGRLFARQWLAAEPADEAGSADVPIVLLHDSLGCVELWRDFPAALCAATGRRVIAYDRLGFGRSAARAGRLPVDFVAEEASTSFPAIRRQLGVDRFVVAGHSVGGGMAVHVAATQGRDCEALVTMSAQAFVEDRTLAGIRAAQAQFREPGQIERLARYHGDKAPWVLEAWIGSWLHPDFASWSLADALPRVTCPTRAIHGERDEYGSEAHPRRIAAGVAGPARVEILPGIGHVPQREAPDRVLQLFAEFLAH